MDKIKCKNCDKEFEGYDSYRKHSSRVHKIKSEDNIISYYLNVIKPTCKCGCGGFTTFYCSDDGMKFREYIQGHQSRVNNNWGHNINAVKKSSETRKRQFLNGERQVWNKGLTIDDERVKDNIQKVMSNPNRGNNISKSLTGVPKSQEHISKITLDRKKYWEAQRIRRSNYIKNLQYNSPSKLEILFKELLDINSIDYEFQYTIGWYNYDFFIKNTRILIEVDGDFYHCNPKLWPEPKYDIQKEVVNHDKIKNEIALQNEYKLLRFWETDIHNNPDEVMGELKKEISSYIIL